MCTAILIIIKQVHHRLFGIVFVRGTIVIVMMQNVFGMLDEMYYGDISIMILILRIILIMLLIAFLKMHKQALRSMDRLPWNHEHQKNQQGFFHADKHQSNTNQKEDNGLEFG